VVKLLVATLNMSDRLESNVSDLLMNEGRVSSGSISKINDVNSFSILFDFRNHERKCTRGAAGGEPGVTTMGCKSERTRPE